MCINIDLRRNIFAPTPYRITLFCYGGNRYILPKIHNLRGLMTAYYDDIIFGVHRQSTNGFNERIELISSCRILLIAGKHMVKAEENLSLGCFFISMNERILDLMIPWFGLLFFFFSWRSCMNFCAHCLIS